MIKNLQEIRHALAVKLGIARSNKHRAQDEGGLKEREALEALQAVEMNWQKAKESVRDISERTLAANLQEQHRERSVKREAEHKIGVTFGKHAWPLDFDVLRDKDQDADNALSIEREPARKVTGLFSEESRHASTRIERDSDKPREMTGLFSKKNRERSRENEPNFLDPDHKAQSKEEIDHSRELEKAIRRQKAREARRNSEERDRRARDRDRGYDLGR